MAWLEPITLSSGRVTLEPLAQKHCPDLMQAVEDGELWRLWYTTVPAPERMQAELERRLALQAAGSMLPFAAVDNGTGKAVGMTTYMNAEPAHRRLEIGSTWYRKAVQKTDFNTRCKLLLLTHAFERLDGIAVEFRTHFFNSTSRAAIERLGAKLDGVLRSHQISPDGSRRDTVVYSILDIEWPAVRSNLRYRLARYA